MSDYVDQPVIVGLRVLGQQFEALEAADEQRRRRPLPIGRAQLVLGVIAAAAVVAIGFSPPVHAVAERVSELLGLNQPTPPPAHQAHPETQTHLELPSDELVNTCQQRLRQAPNDEACLTVVLLASGRLAPGDYTNEEFDRALEQALAESGRGP
jgi:hypothetical protein